MKKLIIFGIIALCSFGSHAIAQTNTTPVITAPDLTVSNAVPDYNKLDFTLGASGYSQRGQQANDGVDISASIDPFKKLPDLWVGVSQSAYWTPDFSGATDIDATWSYNAYGNLCLNPGWSAGTVYGNGNNYNRTGPELTLQYYTSDDAYMYAGVNYDLNSNSRPDWRWSVGIGLEFNTWWPFKH